MSSSDMSLKWNPKNLEIKTRTVERTLEPLVMQVTTLVSSKTSSKKKGKSKRAHVLVAAVERATENFVERGELIAMETSRGFRPPACPEFCGAPKSAPRRTVASG